MGKRCGKERQQTEGRNTNKLIQANVRKNRRNRKPKVRNRRKIKEEQGIKVEAMISLPECNSGTTQKLPILS
jgi:hypothetical protein